MKKKIVMLTAMGIAWTATAGASGYRIPEQSVTAVATSNAAIAATEGPDTAYYNPANMGWQEDRWQVEAGLTYINLPSIDYSDSRSSAMDGSSNTENNILPSLHLISPDRNNFRFGFSFVVPYGLSKRWEDPFPKGSAEEFTLKVLEANPSISYTFCEHFSLAAGARILHTTGNKVKNDAARTTALGSTAVQSDMEGDSTDLGYNLALTLRPLPAWSIAATYRSRVIQSLRGDATLQVNLADLGVAETYRGDVSLDVVLPAVFALSTAYTFDKTTVQLTWDRTYWSSYEELDFNFESPLSTNPYANMALTAAYDLPKPKNWKDADAFRIGITHRCTDRFTAMLGFAYDEAQIPDDTLGFELPDSAALIYSIGAKYRLNDTMQLGAAYLYNHKKKRTIDSSDANINGINGTFENAGAHLLSLGLTYVF